MKERPIIFSTEMVKAILDGRKTQTRRPIKKIHAWPDRTTGKILHFTTPCPYGKPGDRLWTRETWFPCYTMKTEQENPYLAKGLPEVIYKADNPVSYEPIPWKSPIFMPRWASRITLEITDVRVEKLLEMPKEDIAREGLLILSWSRFCESWNSLYPKKPEYQWEANPWVWVISFRKEPK